ncbi:MAG: rRNA maturation RNase YbeY [Flavobacteriales bacterium]|nr:rRNA maturation RNase YbeY [Flavobacteriales bacterium]
MDKYNIFFESHGERHSPDLPTFADWFERALEALEIISADLLYIFCSDEELLTINRDALNHDYYTDIITFDMSDEYSETQLEADMYISVDRVRENATTHNVSYESELKRVMIHGVLHLLGHTDSDTISKVAMRELESKLITL